MGKNIQISEAAFRRICDYFAMSDPENDPRKALADQIRDDLLDKLHRLQAHQEFTDQITRK